MNPAEVNPRDFISYFQGEPNDKDCGSNIALTQWECNQAGGYDYSGTVDDMNSPSGCFVDISSSIYRFNVNTAGNRNPNASPICGVSSGVGNY